jgi:hypothetical protein
LWAAVGPSSEAIDADHQKELDIRHDKYKKLMTVLEDFNKTLYAKQQILGKAKHQLSVINDDYGKGFDANGKLDRKDAKLEHVETSRSRTWPGK